jgi:O-antigen/teichoic acid export membrane protein
MFRNVANIFLGTVITQGSTILLYMVLARLLVVDDFATFRQLFLILAILTAISFSALPTSLLYFSGRSDSDNEKKQYLYLIFILTLAISSLVSISLFGLSEVFSRLFNNNLLNNVLPWFSLSIFGVLAISLMPSVLLVLDKTNMQVYLGAFVSIFVNLPCMTIAYYGATLEQIVQLLSTLYLSVGIFLSLFLAYAIRDIEHDSSSLKHKAKEVLAYSWPLLAASGLSILGLKVDHILISTILGITVYGLYSVGAFEIPVFNILQNSVTSVLIPKVTSYLKQQRYHDAMDIWSIAAKRTAWVTFPLASIFILHAEEIVTLLFGQQYRRAAPIFAIFASLVFVRVVSFGMVLRALGKTRLELLTTCTYVISGILGGYIVTSYFGSLGAATWVVVNTMLLAIILSVLSARCSDQKINIFAVYPKQEFFISLFLLIGVTLVNNLFDVSKQNVYLTMCVNTAALVILWGVAIRRYLNEKTT